MIDESGINNEKYNKTSEKSELMRELTEIGPIILEEFGKDCALANIISDALTYEDLDELRMAKAALDSLPEHLKEIFKTDWSPLIRRPEFKEILTNSVFKGEIRRFLKIENTWDERTEKEAVKGKIVFELLIADTSVTVYVKEGTSKGEALDFLKKAAIEIEESWGLVSDPDQYSENIN